MNTWPAPAGQTTVTLTDRELAIVDVALRAHCAAEPFDDGPEPSEVLELAEQWHALKEMTS